MTVTAHATIHPIINSGISTIIMIIRIREATNILAVTTQGFRSRARRSIRTRQQRIRHEHSSPAGAALLSPMTHINPKVSSALETITIVIPTERIYIGPVSSPSRKMIRITNHKPKNGSETHQFSPVKSPKSYQTNGRIARTNVTAT
jgi:hypothetical protein